jgi:hypothetical protein
MPEVSKLKSAALAVVTVGAAFGLGVLVPESKPDAPAAPTPHVQPAGKPFDAKAYSAQVRAYRAQHPNAVDLLTGDVQPGAQVTTGVNVELGKRPFDVKPSGESWSIDAVGFEDRRDSTWIEVKATNTGDMAARFMGFVDVH